MSDKPVFMERRCPGGSAFFRPRQVILSALLICALMLPSFFWIVRDVTVWSWDPANYGYATLRNVHFAHQDLGTWFASLMAPSASAPLLPQLAQFFVPLSRLFGRMEPALLATNIVLAAITLGLVMNVVRRMTGSFAAAAASALFCGGAALFVAMTTLFFVEMSQIMAISGLMVAAFSANDLHWPHLLPRAVFWIALAMLAKLSSVLFVAALLVYMLVAVLATRGNSKRRLSGRRLAFETVAAVIAAAAAAVWYRLNLTPLLVHATNYSVSDLALLFGSERSLGLKLQFWLTHLSRALSPFALLPLAILALILVSLARVAPRNVRRLSGRRLREVVTSGELFPFCLFGTLVCVLLVYSIQINEDTRFVAPLIPVIAVLFGWALSVYGTVWIPLLSLPVLLGNAAAVEAQAQGYAQFAGNVTGYLQAPRREEGSVRRIAEAEQASCTLEDSPLIGVGVSLPDFNINSLNFEAGKLSRERGFVCNYRSYAPFETQLDAAVTWINANAVRTVVTLPLKDLPADVDARFFAANSVAAPLANWLAGSADFRRVTPDSSAFLIYRRR